MERRSPKLKTTVFSRESFYLDAGILVLDRALRKVLPKRPAVVPLVLVSPDRRSVKGNNRGGSRGPASGHSIP